ncbi:MAG: helix-turn-helix domain-containing protein, partial [Azonexus sp.]
LGINRSSLWRKLKQL